MREWLLAFGIIAMFLLIYELYVLIEILRARHVPTARNEQLEEDGVNEPEPRRGR